MLKVEFSTDNEAFQDSTTTYYAKVRETERILRQIGRNLWDFETSGLVQDANGNTIGKWSLDTKEGE